MAKHPILLPVTFIILVLLMVAGVVFLPKDWQSAPSSHQARPQIVSSSTPQEFLVSQRRNTSNSTTVSSTNQPATTSTKDQLVHFNILQLTFTYPTKAGAVWVDQEQTEDTGPDESYVYRYPYDPENDSDLNSAGEYVYFKNTLGASRFSLEIYSTDANKTTEAYIQHNYPDLDLRTATPYRKGTFSGFIILYSPSPGSNGGEILIFKSGHDVYKMTNDSQMFTDSEFAQIVNSVTPHVQKEPQ